MKQELKVKLDRKLSYREMLLQEAEKIKKDNELHNRRAEIARKKLQK